MSYGFPRRNTAQQWTPAERAIQDAVDAVEVMGADVRLTDAVILLGKAREAVADFVDGVPRRCMTCGCPADGPGLAFRDGTICNVSTHAGSTVVQR